jgi:hypothetical protein
MTIKKQILKFIQKAYENASQTADAPEDEKTSGRADSQNEIIREMFDGMSTGTARIIIDKEMSRELQEKFNIDRVENQGRYYLANIVRQDGSVIQRLLVDKQTGKVQMAGR